MREKSKAEKTFLWFKNLYLTALYWFFSSG